MLFEIEKNRIKNRLKKSPFKFERDLQRFFEENIPIIMPGFEFVKTEIGVSNYRFDSLLYDTENKSFLIVEYKRSEKDSIVDQGYAYLNIIEAHKDSLVLAYNNRNKGFLKARDFDWSQTRVLFVAPSFTKYQKEATNNKKLPFDLMTINKYENNIVEIDYINKTVEFQIKPVTSTPYVTVKTEVDFLEKVDENIKELYLKIKEEVTSWDEDIKVAPTKIYVAFKFLSNFMDIEFTKKYLRVSLNLRKGQLIDGNNLARDMSNVGHGGNGDYEVKVDDNTDYNYFLSLVKQAFDFQKNKN